MALKLKRRMKLHKVRRASKQKPASQTDWKRIRRMRAGKEKIDTSDIPEADDQFWKEASVGSFENKVSLSVRFDSDVVRWFKGQGPRYQTRMNNVLRTYMMWKERDIKGAV